MRRSLPGLLAALAVLLWALLDPPPVEAYIGPGAGFAFVGSFFVFAATLFLVFVKLITAPVRAVVRWLKTRKALGQSRVRRVVIVGYDGQDPELTDRFMAEGLLPNFARLAQQGCYVRLDSTLPSESPVAWSSFQTGCNPGKHRIFDFLVPNRKSYLPELCSAKVRAAGRTLPIGRFRLPLGKPSIDLGRKSRPFWSILGDHGIFSSVIRVPITFPPEKFHGVLLSAMCVPDLKGSQGTFSYYTDEPAAPGAFTGGSRIPVERRDGLVRSFVSGPENSLVVGGGELRIPFEVRVGPGGGAQLSIEGRSVVLERRKYSPWIDLTFRAAPGFPVRAIVRFYLLETEPHFKLYMTPVQIDPDRPAMPISHPSSYAMYLSKTQGRFATLGLAEDTWALNERVLDEQAFLEQAWSIHEERERQLFDALEKTRRGTVVCVFDITDRLQHMFWRYLEPDHPANAGKDVERHRDAVRDLYVRMDDLLGRVMARLDPDTTLMVMSDHGFKPFRRGVNTNTWLWQNGYLALRGEAPTGAQWYQDVDWTRTKAYAVGLGGIYLNVKGREARGIVEPGTERDRIKREIREGLEALRDAPGDAPVVAKVYDTEEAYSGPYVREAPDLFVGFHVGYRASWDCATGEIAREVVQDNTKSWSGDHCMNPPDVPGIFLANRKIDVPRIHIMDIGPTVLDLFGVAVPAWCDGRAVMRADASSTAEGQGPQPKRTRLARRASTLLALALVLPLVLAAAPPAKKTVVLGIDGLDPGLLRRFADEGALPNFSRLMREGDFKPLETTMPPMSPVAWSTFITGLDPAGHGIFDFVHRDPKTLAPYLSMARSEPPARTVALGSWVIPLGAGSVDNLRHGRAFWELLEEHGVPTTVYHMPANFPPVEAGGRALSGMGTPDIRGTAGTFSFYTTREVPGAKDLSGGEVYYVRVTNGEVRGKLYGPDNTFRRIADRSATQGQAQGKTKYRNPPMTVDFTVRLDPERPVARIDVGDARIVLAEGEWSEWVPIEFDAVPMLISVGSIGRFYLKQVRPDFELYVTPLQIDPAAPALPISTPASWSAELVEHLGYFYTQEMPEDTHALTAGIFSGGEFWHQIRMVYDEQRRALDHLLAGFDSGFLFFYFSTADQGSHMLWRYFDPHHPAYVEDAALADPLRVIYARLDEALGAVLAKIGPDTTLIVMSDHGFCPFYRGVSLNTWLLEKGYAALRDPQDPSRFEPGFLDVDWTRTTAYGLGLNGLYVNLAGREKRGIVAEADYDALLDRLERDLLAMRDPATGEPAVTLVTRTRRDFKGAHGDVGPDIIVGYNRGYRSAWDGPLGEFPREVWSDNKQAWSGDHLVDYRLVPGVLLTNRRITLDDPGLADLTVSILDEYGIAKPPEMIGRDCIGGK
jgi:predicted AlkP superfamily phosphohydrolase/phosphomutase